MSTPRANSPRWPIPRSTSSGGNGSRGSVGPVRVNVACTGCRHDNSVTGVDDWYSRRDCRHWRRAQRAGRRHISSPGRTTGYSVFEARSELGGAVASKEVFEGVAARLSRFSYLVSLLPTSIIEELGLRLELRSRRVRSYTPVDAGGLLIERQEGRSTRDSFRALTGDDREYQAWSEFEAGLRELAAVIEPTLTEPLPRAAELRAQSRSGTLVVCGRAAARSAHRGKVR